MNTTSLLIIMLIFIVFIVISLFITESNLRLAYWFVVGLGTLTIINFYSTIVYYIKLRNDPGIPGPRGAKGEKGPKGHIGKCTFSRKCGIQNCDQKIFSIGQEFYPDIPRNCLENPSTCSSNELQEKAIPLNKQLKQLIKSCKTTSRAEEDFMRKIKPQIEFMENYGK
jgi:hypothetical protein